MHTVTEWGKRPINQIIIGSVILSLILPWLFPLFHLSAALRVGILFIVVNMSAAWWFGRMIKRAALPWWPILVLPVLFAGMVLLRYSAYAYFFVPIYLILSLLAMAKD